MGKAFEHILKELDHISLQEWYVLRDLLDQKIISVNEAKGPAQSTNGSDSSDPLAGLQVSTGIVDLAERFDDYRFGR
jgi:hypothetical protein